MSFLKSLSLWIVSLVSLAVALLVAVYAIAHRQDTDIWVVWGMAACVLVFTIVANPFLSKIIPARNRRSAVRWTVAVASVAVGIGLASKFLEPAAQEIQATTDATQAEEDRCMHGSAFDCGAAALGADQLHDGKRAWKLVSRACDLKDNSGCQSVAQRLYKGKGITQNLPLARSIFSKVCDPARNLNFCDDDYLSMLKNGEGGPVDEQSVQQICMALWNAKKDAPCNCQPTSDDIQKCKEEDVMLNEG